MEAENRMTSSSTQLSDLHAQKANAVKSKDFKQATALSQQIRVPTRRAPTALVHLNAVVWIRH